MLSNYPFMYIESYLSFYSQACTVYCRKGKSGKWTPSRGAQFPDGTWCHNDGAQDFFCRYTNNIICLPGLCICYCVKEKLHFLTNN